MINSYKQHLKATFTLAWPVVLSQMSHTLISLADNVMVKDLGAEAVAALGLAIAIFIYFFIFALGYSLGMTPLVAAAHGEGNREEISSWVHHGLYANMGLGIIMVGLFFLLKPFLGLLGQPPRVLALAIEYLDYVIPSLLPVMLFQVFKQFAEGLGVTKPAMYASYAGVVLNIGLGYALIYGWGPFPRMEIAGAGLAALIARMLSALWMVAAVMLNRSLRGYLIHFGLKGLSLRYFKLLSAMGAPIGLQLFFEAACFASAAILAGRLGTTAQAAHQVALSLAAATFLAASGVGAAASVRVGYFYGAKDRANMRRAGFTSLVVVLIYEIATLIFFLLARHRLPTAFVTDVAVQEQAAILLVIAAIFQLSDGIQVVAQGCLRGLQDVRIPTWVCFFSYWVVGLGIAYAYGIKGGGGVEGIWWGLASGLGLSSVLLTVRFFTKSKTVSLDHATAPVVSVH